MFVKTIAASGVVLSKWICVCVWRGRRYTCTRVKVQYYE